MSSFVTIISTEYDKIKRLVGKFYKHGAADVQTALDASPYGIDSNPVKGMVGIYMPTGVKGKTVLVGYLNKDRLSQVGETRLFSTDASGALQTYFWLKNDGTIHLGGSADNLVRYAPLNQGLQDLKVALQAELVAIATGITAGGGSYTPGTLQININDSKIVEIKTTAP